MKQDQIKSIIIVILTLIIVIGGCFFISELSNKGSNTPKYEFTSIGVDDYLALKEGKDASIIYIARPTCTYCQKQEPILKQVATDYNLKVNYLNTDELTESTQTKLLSSDDYFKSGFGTPLLLIVQGNKIVDKAEGLTQKDNLITLFKKYSFIK